MGSTRHLPDAQLEGAVRGMLHSGWVLSCCDVPLIFLWPPIKLDFFTVQFQKFVMHASNLLPNLPLFLVFQMGPLVVGNLVELHQWECVITWDMVNR